ncbi:MAG: HEAT repeat domain-containing protein [Pseudomonadota bacterium]
MAQFRALKTRLHAVLSGDDWREQASPILQEYGRQNVGPLFSFLLFGGAMTGRAALCLGEVVASMADENMESARVIMRRFMWHMNEESGNIGWGIPEAMAACLVAHDGLAKEFHRILISYIRDRDGDSNFCDYAPLRRHCFWAVGSFVGQRPDFVVQSGLVPALFTSLGAGLDDEDAPCRAYAAWTISVCGPSLVQAGMDGNTLGIMLSRLEELSQSTASIELFEDGDMQSHTVRHIVQRAMESIAIRKG